MHRGKSINIMSCVTCLKISCPNFKFEVEIQLHISCKQIEMSYMLGSGNVYTWHDDMCYSKPYICKIVVD
jgi:hypothetical protein